MTGNLAVVIVVVAVMVGLTAYLARWFHLNREDDDE